jgi:type I restriction enzyme, S subunit
VSGTQWPEVTLGELVEIKHGYAFLGEFFGDAGTHVLLTPGNFIESGGFQEKTGDEKFYQGPVPAEYVLNPGDLVIAMTEQMDGLLGSSALIPVGGPYLHNQRIGRVFIRDEAKTDKRFVYYLLNTKPVRHQITASATGTKIRHTAPTRVGAVRVRVPDIEVQRQIASALFAYDALLDNDLRRIPMLEAAARLLYQTSFQDLPVGGHTSLPAGWAMRRLADVAECLGGGTPSTNVPSYWEHGDITWVTPSDVTANKHLVLLDSETKITEAGLRDSAARLIPPQSILMTSRASIGFFAIAYHSVCTNQGFINIVPKETAYSKFLLFQLLDRVEEIRNLASGSTYPEVSRGRFREFLIAVPPQLVAAEFEERAQPLFDQIHVLKRQIQQLKLARDLLLPRLMSDADGSLVSNLTESLPGQLESTPFQSGDSPN